MFTHDRIAKTLFIGVLFFSTATAQNDTSPELGVAVSESELSAINLIVYPNGDGLPSGSGTASSGKTVYDQQCASCHGDSGHGTPGTPALAGGSLPENESDNSFVLTVGSYWPYSSIVFDYVRRSMPPMAPKSLDDNQVYAVVAYLLYMNGIVEYNKEMNATSLPSIAMPNKDGFVDRSSILN